MKAGQPHNAANQVVGWSYDAAGNLLNDSTTTYGYDALDRLVTQDATTNVYNGDGVLVGRARGAGTWTYAQDLVAPLEQMLTVTFNGDATNYLYGHERLRAVKPGAPGSWYHTDALGSVRQTLDGTGAVQATANYAPFGELQGSTITPFGFTGELQDQGLVNLRARWYDPSAGTFTAVDPFAGFPETPYSLNQYQYAYANPVLWTDPSGEIVVGPCCGIGYRPAYDENDRFVGCVEDPDSPEWLEFAKGWKPLPVLPGPGVIVGGATGVAGHAGGAIAGQADGFLRTCALALAVAAGASMSDVNVDTQTRDDNRRDNSMRVQLQEGFVNTFGIPLTAPPRIGVTTRQVRDAMSAIFTQAQTDSISWFPHNNRVLHSWLRTSIIQLSQELNRFPPGGISGRRISFLSKQINHNGRDFRVDLDNLVGHNLRR